MADAVIDAATFAELQEAAGAEFVGELIGTFLEEAPQMLAELRAAQAAGAADDFRRAAHSIKSNANTFGALRLGEMARELELGGLASRCGARRCAAGRIRTRRRRAAGADPWLRAGARLLVADDNKVNRLLLGAQPGAAGPPRGQRRERPRGAGDAASREPSTCCCWTWKCPR